MRLNRRLILFLSTSTTSNLLILLLTFSSISKTSQQEGRTVADQITLTSCCNHQNSFYEGACTDNDDEGNKSNFTEFFHFHRIDYVIEQGPPLTCEDGNYYRADNNSVSLFDVHLDGSLELGDVVYNRNNFCIDEISNLEDGEKLEFSVAMCFPSECSPPDLCLKKCCPWHESATLHSTLHPPLYCDRGDSAVDQLSFLSIVKLKELYEDKIRSDHLDRFNFLPNYRPDCETELRRESKFQILENGNVKILWDNHTWIELDDYCMENITLHESTLLTGQPKQNELVVLYCSAQLQEIAQFTHLKKCCLWEERFIHNMTFGCEDNDPEVGEMFLDNDKLKELYEDSSRSYNLDFSHQHVPSCKTPLRRESKFQILENGNVKIAWGHNSLVELDDYCMENITTQDPTNPEENGLFVLYCSSQLLKQIGQFTRIQMVYCGISWVFILLALIIYLILWRKHSVNGWTQFAFLVSTFFYFLVRFILRLVELNGEFGLSSKRIYKADTFFTFGMLTNLINLSFHMFWTFYKVEPQTLTRDWRDLKRLLVSVSICWTFSAVITLADLLFLDVRTTLRIQLIVMVVLLGSNAVLVCITAAVLWTKLKQRESVSNSAMDQKMMIKLFLKLFFLTGMIWSLKILEQFVKKDIYERSLFWDMVQFVTYTYGVVIFVVFALSSRIIMGLREQFPRLRKARTAIIWRKGLRQDPHATSLSMTTMTPVVKE